MKKINLIAILLLFAAASMAQTKFFTPRSSAEWKTKDPKTNSLRTTTFLQLNEAGLRAYLSQAPLEFKNNGRTIPLEIPLPNGRTEMFNMVESPVLSDKQAALHPEIKTYTGKGTADQKSVIRLSLTSSGFNAIILNVQGDAVYFEKLRGAQEMYYNYFTKDVIIPKGMHVQTGGTDYIENKNTQHQKPAGIAGKPNDPPLNGIGTGTTLTTFRLALAGDGLFVEHNGGTVTSAFNAIVAYVNRVNAFFRNELSVDFTLVSGTNLVFPDANTDPYNNVDQGLQLIENQTVCDDIIGSANYDIGHVMGYIGVTGGGLAALGAVCINEIKGQGLSFEGDPAVITQVINDKLIFHEIGHQFGMTHSYNSSVPVCTSRVPETSVEPGAGITVMSYAMICFDNNFDILGDDYYLFSFPENRALLQYHTTSYQQAVAYMQTIQPYPAGVVVTPTGNTPPVITMPSNYTIPKSTPFALTGSATDIDNDDLTYCWEGTNTGGDEAHPPDANTLTDPSQAPFSRTYAPTNTATRIFPVLDSILNGSNTARADKLPSVSVDAIYNLTVRDNNPAGGGVNYGTVTVTVNGSIGPFLETTNLSGTYICLSTHTINWSVNGTNTATPNVKISLSTDGGYTFPTVLAASTANDGSELVTLPNINTTTARIKVEAVGNIFFDISNVDFAINPATMTYNISASAGANGSVSPNGNVVVNSGANQIFTITSNACYQVADVLVDGISQGPITTYTFNNVTSTHTISVTFSKLSYGIVASAGSNGSISPNGTTTVDCGKNQNYNITANACYQVADVVVDGVSVGVVSNYNFTNVTAPHTIMASFVQATYIITATPGANGTITPDGATSIVCGGTQSYSIAANDCYVIANVVVDGVSKGAVSSYTFNNVTAPHTITATFTQRTYAIVASTGANGSISPAGTTTVACGTNRVYSINPAANYTVENVLVDGVSAGAVTTYTFTNVTATHTISATFKRATGGCTPASLSAVVTPVSCKGNNSGSITLTTTGGTAPFTYAWTGPNNFSATTKNISNLLAGTYTVTVKATGGCSSSATYKVTEPLKALSVTTLAGTIRCSGGATIVWVIATGGTAPYSGTGIKTNQLAGSHTYTVTDARGCTASKTIVIAPGLNAPVLPVISGPASVSSFQSNVQYSVPCVSGQLYIWQVPQGATIISGYGTCSVKVKFGRTSGNIKVTAYNLCGSSAQGVKFITVGNTSYAKEAEFVQTNSTKIITKGLNVRAYPNPSTSAFTLSLDGYNSNEKVFITVTDLIGRKVFQLQQNTSKQIMLGSELKAGLYMLEIQQGTTKQVIKLIKE